MGASATPMQIWDCVRACGLPKRVSRMVDRLTTVEGLEMSCQPQPEACTSCFRIELTNLIGLRTYQSHKMELVINGLKDMWPTWMFGRAELQRCQVHPQRCQVHPLQVNLLPNGLSMVPSTWCLPSRVVTLLFSPDFRMSRAQRRLGWIAP